LAKPLWTAEQVTAADDDGKMAETKSALPTLYSFRWSTDGWAKNQLGERRLGELFFGRPTIGRQARMVRRQQIGQLGNIFQTVGRNV